MLANILGREGRPYLTVASVDGDAAGVARAVRGAAAAAALRGARLGLLGGTIAGYDNVVLEPAGRGGARHRPRDGRCRWRVARDDGLRTSDRRLTGSLPDGLTPTPAAVPLLDRSMRVHRLPGRLVEQERLDALALNCHSDVLRFGEETGVVGCLASTLLWSVGVPVACTGDGVTAVALMFAARIAGSAQYCEGYGVESATGELLVSSCGMADLSLRRAGEHARMHPNALYPGRHGLGIATRFAFEEGPATIIGFGPPTATRPGRLVMSVGRLTGRGFEHLNGPSGTVTFDAPGAGQASARLDRRGTRAPPRAHARRPRRRDACRRGVPRPAT